MIQIVIDADLSRNLLIFTSLATLVLTSGPHRRDVQCRADGGGGGGGVAGGGHAAAVEARTAAVVCVVTFARCEPL
jgi:hypothetical protein